MLIQIIFFILIVSVIYTYFGYPLLLAFLSSGRKGSGDRTENDEANLPGIALLIAAYNEENIIEEKILNSLALSYPEGRLTIAVVSDGSTDRTDEITMKYKEKGVKLIRVEGRQGKTILP